MTIVEFRVTRGRHHDTADLADSDGDQRRVGTVAILRALHTAREFSFHADAEPSPIGLYRRSDWPESLPGNISSCGIAF